MMHSNYKPADFRLCQFNPLTEGPMLTAYPLLSDAMLSEWLYYEKIDLLIRYVILVYDPKSPLVQDERDLNRRKRAALDMIEITDEETQDKWIRHDHEFLPELISKFLERFLKSREYAVLAALEFKFWESVQITLTPVSGRNSKEELESLQKKSLVAEEMDKDIKRLDLYHKQYFMDDTDLVRKVKKRFSPERMAGLGDV